MNIREVVYKEIEFLRELVPFAHIRDVAATLWRVETAVNKRIAELEHAGKIEGGIAALHARTPMSKAEGINGWRWTRPWNAETTSPN